MMLVVEELKRVEVFLVTLTLSLVCTNDSRKKCNLWRKKLYNCSSYVQKNFRMYKTLVQNSATFGKKIKRLYNF